jgi:hypothetical protein
METPETRPTTYQKNLAKLPPALAPLCERPQWAVWRWTLLAHGRWQKPPFMACKPQRHASVKDPSTWTDYNAALAAVQAGHADGLTYLLTDNDPFAAIDLDHCRDANTHSIEIWAQNFLDTARYSYSEVTPSGTGCRIWGLTTSGDSVHKKFSLLIDGKEVAVELFRRTNKALTVTGYKLDTVRELTDVDSVIDWGVIWAERRKAVAANAAAKAATPTNGFSSNGSKYSIDAIEQIVRDGAPAGGNRSDFFHSIIGHYVGCGWSVEQIAKHLQQFPDGIGGRYLAEHRLHQEIARSAGKYAARALPLFDGNRGRVNGWDANTPQLTIAEQQPAEPEPELDKEDPELDEDGENNDNEDIDIADNEDGPASDAALPPLYAHGDPDQRPLKSWLIKRLIPTAGHGLLSGQWGAGKTFIVFDLAAALATGQPFIGHAVKRRCGVLLIAAEGADEVRLRLDAVVREKCGGMGRAPFRWYETAPPLLHHGSAELLIAMAGQADQSLQEEFGLPLGLIVIDTIAACAGYTKAGDENDAATGQAVMNVLKVVAQELNCFVLGVDHFGKSLEAGTRGASSKEAAADLVLACLGDKELSGNVVDTRLAVRKNRGGRQGREYPFALRIVETPEPDEDGEPVNTMVVDWNVTAADGAYTQSDPWAAARRQDQRTAVLRLKRVLMELLADQGVALSIPPDGSTARMIDQETVRERFYARTPANGTPEQKVEFRRKRFNRAVDWAENQELIAIEEIDDVTYLRLVRPESGEDEKG